MRIPVALILPAFDAKGSVLAGARILRTILRYRIAE